MACIALTSDERRGWDLCRQQVAAVLRELPKAARRKIPCRDRHENYLIDMAGLFNLADEIERIEPDRIDTPAAAP